ncbi:MAG: tetratricopeptide repeat protein [Pseudomonadota bacterium]|nr:tetratricopeptide repeat protein [Pseudomonadota bacterium]
MKDLTGLDTTVHSADALSAFNEAVNQLILFQDPMDAAQRALETEPDFVMGQVFYGYVHLWSTDKDDLAAARTALAACSAAAARANARERLHIRALEYWAGGDLWSASQLLDALLYEYPTDVLALMTGHQLDFFLGDAMNLRGRVARALPFWDRQHPLWGCLLGMYSFGLEEAGEYRRAEEAALAAVEANELDIWGIHALAHTLEMLGEYDRGSAFMARSEPQWAVNNMMITHNAIHYDLFMLEQHRLDDIVRHYDRDVHPAGAPPLPMALVDASSVLWRLYLENVDTGSRFRQLAANWDHKKDQQFYVFNDAHAIMAYAGAGDHRAAAEVLDGLRRYVAGGDTQETNYRMTAEVGLPVCEAVNDFALGQYGSAVQRLLPLRYRFHHFGGSHVQRDVLERTLLEAALRDGNKALAASLVAERIGSRPHSTYNHIKQEAVLAL